MRSGKASAWKLSPSGDVGADAADGEVHVGQAPGGVVGLLAVDADVAEAAAVLLDELLAADEHAARAAAGVVDAALVRRQHLDEHADDAAGRVELAALLALGAGELGEEVLVDAAEDVLGAIRRAAEADVADTRLISWARRALSRPGRAKSLGRTPLRVGFSRSMASMASSTDAADRGLGGLRLEVGPAGLARDPEDAGGLVLVGVLGVGAFGCGRPRPARRAWPRTRR